MFVPRTNSKSIAGYSEVSFTKIIILILIAAGIYYGIEWSIAHYEAAELGNVALGVMYQSRGKLDDNDLNSEVYEKLKQQPSVRINAGDVNLEQKDGRVKGRINFIYFSKIPFLDKTLDFAFSRDIDEDITHAGSGYN